MSRTVTPEFLAQLLQSGSEPCYLIEVIFDSVTYRMTDAWRSIDYAGYTYLAQGHFLSFNGLSETLDMQIPSITITLSGIDQSWIAHALTLDYLDRRVIIYKGFIDYANGVVNAPVVIFDGRIDTMPIADDPAQGTTTVALVATNQFKDFDRTVGRHTNDEDQQMNFPGDKFFEYVPQLTQARQIQWGPK
jgi:hypothetical protein